MQNTAELTGDETARELGLITLADVLDDPTCTACGAPGVTDGGWCDDCTEIGSEGAGYDDACAALVSSDQARREIGRHDCPGDCEAHGADGHATAWEAFVCDHGERATYRGRVVLDWLGY